APMAGGGRDAQPAAGESAGAGLSPESALAPRPPRPTRDAGGRRRGWNRNAARGRIGQPPGGRTEAPRRAFAPVSPRRVSDGSDRIRSTPWRFPPHAPRHAGLRVGRGRALGAPTGPRPRVSSSEEV